MDVIITNPPFGGVEKPGPRQLPADVQPRETADLFLVLIKHPAQTRWPWRIWCYPDGFVRRGVKTRIRAIARRCNLHTIVRLPNGVFAPLHRHQNQFAVFTKGQPTTDVWYYEHPYPAGVKTYNKTKPIALKNSRPETRVGQRGRRLCQPGGKRARVEGQH